MRILRRLGGILVLAALAALPAAAAAHAGFVSSDPAAGAALEEPPDEVVVVFDEELDPDRSALAVVDASGREVADGGVDLQVAERNQLRADVSIGDGAYEVRWTAVASDGHAERGSFTFSVGEGTPGAPDTALTGPAAPLPFIGMALVALALLFVPGRREPPR